MEKLSFASNPISSRSLTRLSSRKLFYAAFFFVSKKRFSEFHCALIIWRFSRTQLALWENRGNRNCEGRVQITPLLIIFCACMCGVHECSEMFITIKKYSNCAASTKVFHYKIQNDTCVVDLDKRHDIKITRILTSYYYHFVKMGCDAWIGIILYCTYCGNAARVSWWIKVVWNLITRCWRHLNEPDASDDWLIIRHVAPHCFSPYRAHTSSDATRALGVERRPKTLSLSDSPPTNNDWRWMSN